MIEIDQFIVYLWFLPVTVFILLPLIISCIDAVCSVVAEFRPYGGVKRARIIDGK